MPRCSSVIKHWNFRHGWVRGFTRVTVRQTTYRYYLNQEIYLEFLLRQRGEATEGKWCDRYKRRAEIYMPVEIQLRPKGMSAMKDRYRRKPEEQGSSRWWKLGKTLNRKSSKKIENHQWKMQLSICEIKQKYGLSQLPQPQAIKSRIDEAIQVLSCRFSPPPCWGCRLYGRLDAEKLPQPVWHSPLDHCEDKTHADTMIEDPVGSHISHGRRDW